MLDGEAAPRRYLKRGEHFTLEAIVNSTTAVDRKLRGSMDQLPCQDIQLADGQCLGVAGESMFLAHLTESIVAVANYCPPEVKYLKSWQPMIGFPLKCRKICSCSTVVIASRNLKKPSLALAAFLFALGIGGIRQASAQTFTAQISGIVRDRQGAAIPDAIVHAKDDAKGTDNQTVSNASGEYQFSSLLPSTYTISAEKNGFKQYEQRNVSLEVNQSLRLDITLDVGAVTESVTITAEPGNVLDTTSASLGQVVTAEQVEELPLDIRDPMSLITLTPGVVLGSDFGTGGGPNVGRNFTKSNFNVGGGRSGSNAILIDGAPNTTADLSKAIINPPLDAIQEYKVIATSYDAQFGRTSGGVISMLTKSGSNRIHGTVYDFERDSTFDATNYFATGNAVDYHRRQAGAVIGFPILSNRWFGFADFESLRQGVPDTQRSTVPTPAERIGDFSSLTYTNGSGVTKPVVIYDPATYSAATNARTQLACNGIMNVICPNRIDPLASKLVNMYPLPNNPGGVNNANNYVYTANQFTYSHKYDFRSDVNLGGKTTFFGRFSRQNDHRLIPGVLPPAESGGITNDLYTQVVLSLSHLVSSKIMVNVTTSFSRANAIQVGGLPTVDLAATGFSNNFASQAAPQLPQLSMSDVTDLQLKSNVGQQHQPRNTYATTALVTDLVGRHALKFGGEWWILNFNEYQNPVASGLLLFNHFFTQKSPSGASSKLQGADIADLLLGFPSGTNPVSGNSGSYIQKVQAISTQGLYYAGFVQDDYRATDHLTLNMGIRWDVNIGDREKYDRLAWFDPNAPSPLGPSIGNPQLKGSVVWAGHGNDRNQQQTSWTNVNPRFGFAYQAPHGFVLRGGYGIYFLPRSIQGNGVGAVETTVQTYLPVDGPMPSASLEDPFASGVSLPNDDRSPIAGVGSAISIPTHDFKAGYVQLFSFGFQRQLPGNILTDVHYWGNLGTHIPTTANLNQLPTQYLSMGAALASTQVPNVFYGVIPGQAAMISLRQSLLPYPQYSGDDGLAQQLVPVGRTNYSALTAQAQKRFSRNYGFTVQYTWGKSMDNLGTPVDYANRAAEYAESSLDVTNQITASFMMLVPYGRGQRWGANSGQLVNALLGGWHINGLVSLQSGFPVGVSRPSTLAPGAIPKVSNPTPQKWFDTTGISLASYSYGNIGPDLPGVRSDPTRNLDVNVSKEFRCSWRRESILQIRAESYNVLNHPLFSAPVGTITSANFGTVTSQRNQPRGFQFGAKYRF